MSVFRDCSGIVHRLAICEECDWRRGQLNTALDEAKKHVNKTGHSVTVETGSFAVYKKETR